MLYEVAKENRTVQVMLAKDKIGKFYYSVSKLTVGLLAWALGEGIIAVYQDRKDKVSPNCPQYYA